MPRPQTEYHFDWDPVKAKANLRKHRISFERASTVLLDPIALSIYDEKHSEKEDRWITLGLDQSGVLLTICHTFTEEIPGKVAVRMISARKATRNERRQYEGKP